MGVDEIDEHLVCRVSARHVGVGRDPIDQIDQHSRLHWCEVGGVLAQVFAALEFLLRTHNSPAHDDERDETCSCQQAHHQLGYASANERQRYEGDCRGDGDHRRDHLASDTKPMTSGFVPQAVRVERLCDVGATCLVAGVEDVSTSYEINSHGMVVPSSGGCGRT